MYHSKLKAIHFRPTEKEEECDPKKSHFFFQEWFQMWNIHFKNPKKCSNVSDKKKLSKNISLKD